MLTEIKELERRIKLKKQLIDITGQEIDALTSRLFLAKIEQKNNKYNEEDND